MHRHIVEALHGRLRAVTSCPVPLFDHLYIVGTYGCPCGRIAELVVPPARVFRRSAAGRDPRQLNLAWLDQQYSLFQNLRRRRIGSLLRRGRQSRRVRIGPSLQRPGKMPCWGLRHVERRNKLSPWPQLSGGNIRRHSCSPPYLRAGIAMIEGEGGPDLGG